MADDSPGKVQALRAIFSEKNNPIMAMMPPGGKMSNRPWKSVIDSTEDSITLRERIITEQKISSQLITKVLPLPVKKPEVIANGELHKGLSTENSLHNVAKPSVGPKPFYLMSQMRTSSSLNDNLEPSDTCDTADNGTLNDLLKSQAKSKAVAETIASFMFTNGLNQRPGDPVPSEANKKGIVPPPLPGPRNSKLRLNMHDQVELNNLCNSQNTEKLANSDPESMCRNLINSDNYICKSNCNFKRKQLPPIEKLGPPPLKPPRPSQMVLPAKYKSSPPLASPAVKIQKSSPQTQTAPSIIPHRPAPQRPSYPCPPRPHTPPPLPPLSSHVVKLPLSLREEIEELYEDTLLGENKRPVSLIPEYTEEEETEELYNDAGPVEDIPPCFPSSSLMKPKDPPPPRPTEYLQPNVHSSNEELYQDAEDPDNEEFYEEMPCDTLIEEPGSPLYSNNKKEIEKLRREEEKKFRKEQKEKEKREKEMEKLKRKFGLTGDEVPIDDGLVKMDSRGGKGDLPVKKGETVLILRMEGNPSGRWLVKNEKGKIGYVELTNIEVDPLSVKSVMSIRRQSVISVDEELYSEARSEEEEAIYETTY